MRQVCSVRVMQGMVCGVLHKYRDGGGLVSGEKR
jgi:hypothetical protein